MFTLAVTESVSVPARRYFTLKVAWVESVSEPETPVNVTV